MGFHFLGNMPLPLSRDNEYPYLIYETTIGDMINHTLACPGPSKDPNLVGCQDHAKPWRIFFVSSGGPLIKARKVISEEDAKLLRERLDTYLLALRDPTIYGSGYYSRSRMLKNSEYTKFEESIVEVDARSEPVDVYETMVEMGYMKPRDYDFSPVEPFEEIGVDTVSDQEEDGSASKQKKYQYEGSGTQESNANVN